MSSKDVLVNFLNEQIDIENKIVRSMRSALGEIENLTVKGVLKGISLDSVKHADMYAAAIDLLTETPKNVPQEQIEKRKELVEEHIRLEAELIERIGERIPGVRDKQVKLLLNAILSDEKRHHKLLKKLLKNIVSGEALTEEFAWSALHAINPLTPPYPGGVPPQLR